MLLQGSISLLPRVIKLSDKSGSGGGDGVGGWMGLAIDLVQYKLYNISCICLFFYIR